MNELDGLEGRRGRPRELVTGAREFLQGRPGEFYYERGYARRRPAYRTASRSFVRAKLRAFQGPV